MRNIYLNQIVDITDSNCEFIQEFDREIKKYGAVVYNQDYNTYQFIRNFEMIDYKKEVLPDFIKVEDATGLKGLKITVHYEFDPETEDDPENLEVWNELKETELNVFAYDEDGEAYIDREIKLNTKNSVHTIWFLSEKSFDYILDTDLLMLYPYIKNINIARDLIRNYGVHPFETKFNLDEIDRYEVPDMSYYFASNDEEEEHEHEHHHHHDEHYNCGCEDECGCDDECDCEDEECHCGHHHHHEHHCDCGCEDGCDCDDECDCDSEECHCGHHHEHCECDDEECDCDEEDWHCGHHHHH